VQLFVLRKKGRACAGGRGKAADCH